MLEKVNGNGRHLEAEHLIGIFSTTDHRQTVDVLDFLSRISKKGVSQQTLCARLQKKGLAHAFSDHRMQFETFGFVKTWAKGTRAYVKFTESGREFLQQLKQYTEKIRRRDTIREEQAAVRQAANSVLRGYVLKNRGAPKKLLEEWIQPFARRVFSETPMNKSLETRVELVKKKLMNALARKNAGPKEAQRIASASNSIDDETFFAAFDDDRCPKEDTENDIEIPDAPERKESRFQNPERFFC